MSLTVQQVARITNATGNTIVKLIREGHLQGKKDDSRPAGRWVISTPKADLKRIVVEHAPGAGWKKKGNGHANNYAPSKPVDVPRTSGLHEVLAFAALDAATRQCLLAMADRFTADELKILATL